MRHGKSIAAVVLLVAAALLVSCSYQNKPKRIKVITDYVDVHLLTERVGIEEAAYRAQVALSWKGTYNRDAQRQIEFIESAIAERSYGIAVNPASQIALNAAVRDALAKKIPVVILMNPIRMAPSPHLHYVLEDPFAGAVLVSQRIDELIKGRGEVALFGLNPLYPGSAERFQNVEIALRRDVPRIVIDDHSAGPFGNGYLEIAAQQILMEHPRLMAVVALNVESGLAAVAAIRALHMQNKVHVIVFDASLQVFHLLRSGEIDSFVVQDTRGIGAKAISAIVDDRNGRSVSDLTYLKPRLVTRANIDHEDVQQFLLMKWQHP
jgi:ribose transport system substrate-binding protein